MLGADGGGARGERGVRVVRADGGGGRVENRGRRVVQLLLVDLLVGRSGITAVRVHERVEVRAGNLGVELGTEAAVRVAVRVAVGVAVEASVEAAVRLEVRVATTEANFVVVEVVGGASDGDTAKGSTGNLTESTVSGKSTVATAAVVTSESGATVGLGDVDHGRLDVTVVGDTVRATGTNKATTTVARTSVHDGTVGVGVRSGAQTAIRRSDA